MTKRKKSSADLKDIYSPIRKALDKVEKEIKKNLHTQDPLLSDIYKHILHQPGKKLRPALVLFSAGTNNPQVSALAAAVEIIHMATLIHDDVIDEAARRRRQVSLNRKWGSEIAILAGDNLFAAAFSLLTKNVPPSAMHMLAKSTERMCEGEMRQIKHRFDLNLKETDYLRIIEDKTAVFMATCCQLGALVGGGNERIAGRLKEYGLKFGMAFQIIDDCFDLIGKEDKLGKSLGADIRMGKLTLPLIYFLKENRKTIKTFDGLIKLWSSPRNRLAGKVIRDSLTKAQGYIIQAKEEIRSLREPLIREKLLNLSDYILDR